MTLERYTHLVDEIRKDAANKIDEILQSIEVRVGVKTEKDVNQIGEIMLILMVNAVGIEPTTY